MQFTFSPWLKRSRGDDTVFTIKRIWQKDADRKDSATEISHLIDRSYRYRSEKELRWHLAERFGLPREGISLSRA